MADSPLKSIEDARMALDAENPDYEAMEELESMDDQTLLRVLTPENTKKLLTVWGNDPVNDFSELSGLCMLSRIPTSIVQFHGMSILKHLDDVVDDKYGWHENYVELWAVAVQAVAEKCAGVLEQFVEGTLVPRLKEEAHQYNNNAGDENGNNRPSLFQTTLLDTAAQLGEIALAKPALLTSTADKLLPIVQGS